MIQNDKMGINLFVIGNKLRELREKKRVTQMQVVEALDVSYTHYAKIEEGVRGMSIQMLFKLMNYFDTDANTILGVSIKGGGVI
ncbi:MAG: helix-turn-helix transcriptional regulator [Lachnospiraceae bacterium]|nr:helix-turn-helix transcriptional regulator [Lachnospiraceae bacterium]